MVETQAACGRPHAQAEQESHEGALRNAAAAGHDPAAARGPAAETMSAGPTTEALETLHRATVELARLGGAEITHALGRRLAVRYKTDRPDEHILRDPVSDADVKVEKMIRDHVEHHFPDHAVLGEEMGADTLADCDYVWAIDPID